MTRSVKWTAATALAVVLLFVAAWFLLISPKHAAAADLREQAAAKEAGNLLLQRKISVLKRQAQDLPKQRARLEAIAQHLPGTPELPTLLRSIDKEAKASGVVVQKLNPVVPVTAEKGSSTTPAATPSPAGNTGPYLQSIAFEIKVAGSFAQLKDFLHRSEDIRRSILTTQVVVEAADSKDPKLVNGKLVVDDKLVMTMYSSAFIATPNAPRPLDGGATAAR